MRVTDPSTVNVLREVLEVPKGDMGYHGRTPIYNYRMVTLRRAQRLEQQDLASLLGISDSYVSHIETLWTMPSEDLAKDIADTLGTTVDDLFPGWMHLYIRRHEAKEISVLEEVLAIWAEASEQRTYTTAEGKVGRKMVSLPPGECWEPSIFRQAPDDLEDLVLQQEKREVVLQVLSRLPRRSRIVILLRFGFFGKIYTLDEIAPLLKLHRSRVQQIEKKTLRDLRDYNYKRQLRPLLE